jgi:flagellar basal-body rod protein FlgB
MARADIGANSRTIDIGGEAAPNGNNVSLEEQMALSTDARSKHDLALTVYRSSLNILKTSMGRGGR